MTGTHQEWPTDWPRYSQRLCDCDDCRCTMLVGPCNCGAWHQEGEFALQGQDLYRNGKLIEHSPARVGSPTL
jgi:hypothetical protein